MIFGKVRRFGCFPPASGAELGPFLVRWTRVKVLLCSSLMMLRSHQVDRHRSHVVLTSLSPLVELQELKCRDVHLMCCAEAPRRVVYRPCESGELLPSCE